MNCPGFVTVTVQIPECITRVCPEQTKDTSGVGVAGGTVGRRERLNGPETERSPPFVVRPAVFFIQYIL